MESHSAVRLKGSLVRYGLVSHQDTKRLVVFVHGFLGRASATWGKFATSPPESQWWDESDLLFVGYRSFFDSVPGTADRLRDELSDFYPFPCEDLVAALGETARDNADRPYEELILVGHSLGGVVIRIAVADSADAVVNPSPHTLLRAEQEILDAQVRLFSPAISGYLGSGAVGSVQELSGMLMSVPLRLSAAYRHLQAGSPLLVDTRKRTERHARGARGTALKASILWANPENIVHPIRYSSDYTSGSVRGKNHLAVCKPRQGYDLPWRFVESGNTR